MKNLHAASSGTHSPTSTGMGISEPSPASVLSNFPEAPAKLKRNPSGVARVLTSKENMELLEAKEKRELKEEKKKRKEEQECKAREREQQKREKERI